MTYNKITLIFTALVLLALVPVTYAREDSASTGKYPSAVLVQLRSEHNRITALTKDRRYADLAIVEHDNTEVMKRIHLDFHDNFHYCPVYYYMDTNADLIKERKFEGVLINEDGTQAHNIIPAGDSSYVIAYYGQALAQAKYHKVQKDETRHLTADELLSLRAQSIPSPETETLLYSEHDPPLGKGLVILNSKYQQITYFYKTGADEVQFALKRKKLKQYYYKSKRFDIEYYPSASVFNSTMLDRYGRRRIIAPRAGID
jgi:hypothetical protein